MEDYPVKLARLCLLQLLGIVLHPLYTDKDITLHRFAFRLKFERNNIGIVIMPEIGLVDLQNLLITAKNVIQVLKLFSLAAEQRNYKLL